MNMDFATFADIATENHNHKRWGRWAEYEARKRELQRRGLSSTEYMAELRALVMELRL